MCLETPPLPCLSKLQEDLSIVYAIFIGCLTICGCNKSVKFSLLWPDPNQFMAHLLLVYCSSYLSFLHRLSYLYIFFQTLPTLLSLT